MASDALKQEFKTTFAENFEKAFANDSIDQYFLMFGKVDGWGITQPASAGPYGTDGENYPASNTDSIERGFQAFRDGVGAKRISSRNIYRMIPRNDWTYGITYDQYSSSEDMFGTASGTQKRFYVYTSTGNVYKCIGNTGAGAEGPVSQFEPSHTISDVVTLEDGYRWKFIYKVTDDSKDFLTNEYIPVQYTNTDSSTLLNQWNAQQSSVKGTIDHINITAPSSGWTAAQWIKSTPPNTVKNIQGDSEAGVTYAYLDELPQDNEYYVGYSLYISAGPGTGQKRKIVKYTNADSKAEFNIPLTEAIRAGDGGFATSSYQIMPNIIFDGDGNSAEALAITDSDGYLTGVSVLNSGENYTAIVPKIEPLEVSGGTHGGGLNVAHNIQGPTLSPVISPGGGHAFNAIQDFQSDKVMIRTVVKGTDSNFVAGSQDIRQVSLIKNPKINGGTYDGWTAGSEISRRKQLTVAKPYFSTVGFSDGSFLSPTGKTGDTVMGENTKATGLIESWTYSASNPEIGTLELTNVRGNFEVDTPGSNLTRIVFSDNASGITGNFVIGRTIKQHNGLAGASGATAVGKVHAWSASGVAETHRPFKLIVDVSKNSFVDDEVITQYDTNGNASTPTWAGTDVVERKMGELLKHHSSTQGLTFEFYKNSDGNQNIARANTLTDVQDEETLEKSYRLTTKLIIEDNSGSPSLTADTYTVDAILQQEHLSNTGGATSGIITTGKIVSWSANDGGGSGELYLNDVRGSFVTGGFSSGSRTNDGITFVTEPELQIGSGEVLYIQNIRPISRTAEQDEEIKILIGF